MLWCGRENSNIRKSKSRTGCLPESLSPLQRGVRSGRGERASREGWRLRLRVPAGAEDPGDAACARHRRRHHPRVLVFPWSSVGSSIMYEQRGKYYQMLQIRIWRYNHATVDWLYNLYWPLAERAAGEVASLFREFSFSFPLFPKTNDIYQLVLKQ